ncbi:MAG TPA: amidohydrolase family protein [Feifaniaceae bacterium]|nr:amidohydrolase family protein [Feifaniaceae bacterium]
MYFKLPICDVHIHAWDMDSARETLSMVDELGYEKFVMLSAASYALEAVGNNLACAWVKLNRPGRGYAFAAAHYPENGAPSAADLLKQTELFHALGFDGIKMMDGKPNMRRRIGVPLNSPVFDEMFSFMEDKGIPLLYHVNDPWEFWEWDKMPEWAKAMGGRVYYGGGVYPGKRQIEDEAVDILNKHPRLRVVFPHFFFTAADIGRTKELFDAYPNMSYDITPGWEMFESFAERYPEWRRFFMDYSSRILFGSDTISGHWRETVSCLKRAMETGEEFTAFEERCKGLDLPDETLADIYKNNFGRFIPFPPRPMDTARLIAYGESLYGRAQTLKEHSTQKAKASIDEALAALKAME